MEIQNNLNYILDKSKTLGADKAEVIFNKNSKFSLKVNEGELEEYGVANTHIAGLRIIKDNKVGLAFSESLGQDALDNMIKQAINFSKYAEVDETQDICVSHENPIVSNDKSRNQDDHTSTQEKIELALALEAGIKEKDATAKCPYNGYSDNINTSYVANTEGAFCFEEQKTFSCFLSALLNKDGKSSMQWDTDLARNFRDLKPNNVIKKSYELASSLLDGEPIKTGHYDIIFSPETLRTFFAAFSNLFSGKAAMDGLNPLKDKMNDKIASDLFTLKDIPTYKKGFQFQMFDSEGSLSPELTLIDQGELKSFLHNSQTAKYFNLANNGRAARSAQSSLSTGGTNKIIEVGTTASDELHRNTYLEIIDMQGMHSGSDTISGDFSVGAAGFLIKDGKRIQPVKGITLSGNFYKMLNNISGLGNELKHDSYKTFFAPEIRWKELTIGGN